MLLAVFLVQITMSGIVRSVFRIACAEKTVLSNSSKRRLNAQCSRPLWHMCDRLRGSTQNSYVKMIKSFVGYNLECSRSQHTKAERELVEFLAEEIVAEKNAQKLKTIPTDVDGFGVALNGANVTLVKKQGDETITIFFNVNHTVDAENDPEINPNDEKPEFGEMKSKPNFTVNIVRGKLTLGFSCSFNNEEGASGADDSYNDCFGVDEISLYEGEHNDEVYAVAGEVIDGYLYDLLMNYLEEKGVSNEFAEKLVDLSTSYEHSAYISLLEGLSKFTAAN